MARVAELVIRVFTDDEGIKRVGLTRELVADDGARTRTKGGIWVALTDVAALEQARDRALDFAQACDEAIGKIASAKAAPKPPRKAPTPPTPAQKAAVKPAIASLPKPAPATGRVTTAPKPRVVAPTPKRDEADDLLDWISAVRA